MVWDQERTQMNERAGVCLPGYSFNCAHFCSLMLLTVSLLTLIILLLTPAFPGSTASVSCCTCISCLLKQTPCESLGSLPLLAFPGKVPLCFKRANSPGSVTANKHIPFKEIFILSFSCWLNDFWKDIQVNPMIYLIQFMCYGSEKVTLIIILKLPPSYESSKILTSKQHGYASL